MCVRITPPVTSSSATGPIVLTPAEKDIARRVVLAFGQNICGFDLLRTEQDKSYVCDVNGFSFVKRARHYYDDCALIMRNMILEACNPDLLEHDPVIPPAIPSVVERAMPNSVLATEAELRCVIGVIRHGDRSPKQKLKATLSYPEYMQFFDGISAADIKHELKVSLSPQSTHPSFAIACLRMLANRGNTIRLFRHSLLAYAGEQRQYGPPLSS